ncbi:hypothetical protein LCGC14_2005550 [marine sediment metagenome]|uniref:Uncharacterized protein n=1 Tax=marine sediment metagenome TaxID=412755 RepID=A0A0F9HFA9_9ZZZZ
MIEKKIGPVVMPIDCPYCNGPLVKDEKRGCKVCLVCNPEHAGNVSTESKKTLEQALEARLKETPEKPSTKDPKKMNLDELVTEVKKLPAGEVAETLAASPEVTLSFKYIKNKTEQAKRDKQSAHENLGRVLKNVAEVEERVGNLPAEIDALEDLRDDAIAEGKGTATLSKKITELRAELESNEIWLNKGVKYRGKNHPKVSRATDSIERKRTEHLEAQGNLQMVEDKAADYCLAKYFTDRFNAYIKAAFEVREQWEQLKVKIRRDPELLELYGQNPMGSNVKVNAAPFVATIIRDRDKIKILHNMFLCLAGNNLVSGDIKRGERYMEAEVSEQSRELEAAEQRKTAGYKKREETKAKNLAVKKDKAGKRILHTPPKSPERCIPSESMTEAQARESARAELVKQGSPEIIAKQIGDALSKLPAEERIGFLKKGIERNFPKIKPKRIITRVTERHFVTILEEEIRAIFLEVYQDFACRPVEEKVKED